MFIRGILPKTIQVHRPSLRYKVKIDPTLKPRGECQHTRPGIYEPATIVLRQWDEEVFLHEILHALLREANMVMTHTDVPRVSADEEELVSQVSHGLYEMGWRLVPLEVDLISDLEDKA